MVSFSSGLCSFGVLFCLLDSVSAQVTCNRGPDALTNGLRTNVPQTCIEVPEGDESDETQTRCYYTYVPESCSLTEPVPLVVDVHGFGGCPLWHTFYSGWKEKADENCFAVVWPSGTFQEDGDGGCFQLPGFLRSEDYGTTGGNNVTTSPCCCGGAFLSRDSGINDPLFLKMTIDQVIADTPSSFGGLVIDTKRVYMTGHSNGCIASLSMAALYSETIAAVCCTAGALATPFPDPDDYSSPVPIWMVHGMKDDTIEYDGSSYTDELGFWSMDQTMDYLAKQNGCSAEVVTESDLVGEDKDENEAIIGTIYQRTDCKADVELVALFEAGHFPYKVNPIFERLVTSWGETPVKTDTTAMAWEFCSAHTNEDTVVVKEEDPNEVEKIEEEEGLNDVENDGKKEEEEEEEEETQSTSSSLTESSAWKLRSCKFFLGALLSVSILGFL